MKNAPSTFAIVLAIAASACGKVEQGPSDSSVGSDAGKADVGVADGGLSRCTGVEPNRESGAPICYAEECLRIGDSLPLRVCQTWEKLYRCPVGTPLSRLGPKCHFGPYSSSYDGSADLSLEYCCP